MALSIFDDKARPPGPGELESAIGRTGALWEGLRGRVRESYGPVADEWAFAGAKFGWSLRLKDRKRVVLYLIPCKGHFLAGVVLGEKAVQAVRGAGLPEGILRMVDEAKPYSEGRGIRVEVRKKGDAAAVWKLVTAKMEA